MPGEAAGVGAGGVMVVGVAMRRLSWRAVLIAAEETAKLPVLIFVIALIARWLPNRM